MAARSRAGLSVAEAKLRAHALAKPSATEHFPWGERAIKVNGKVFLFMHADATRLSLSTKLPRSGPVARMLPFAEPTGYGLGKAGWVSARFEAGEAPPLEMLCAWIDESYQAVAPAKLAALARDGEPARPAALTRTGTGPSARRASPAARRNVERTAAKRRNVKRPRSNARG